MKECESSTPPKPGFANLRVASPKQGQAGNSGFTYFLELLSCASLLLTTERSAMSTKPLSAPYAKYCPFGLKMEYCEAEPPATWCKGNTAGLEPGLRQT